MHALYDDPLPQEVVDERPITPEEDSNLSDIRAIDALRLQPGWPKLLAHLQDCRSMLVADLVEATDINAISRLQGSVHALNLFFGTTESLLSEGAFLRSLNKPKAS